MKNFHKTFLGISKSLFFLFNHIVESSVHWFLQKQSEIFWKCVNFTQLDYSSSFHHSALYLTGLNKLQTQLQACTQHCCNKVFACTKFCVCKSIKTPLSSPAMLFKVASCSCIWKQIIFCTITSGTHNLFQLRSCC